MSLAHHFKRSYEKEEFKIFSVKDAQFYEIFELSFLQDMDKIELMVFAKADSLYQDSDDESTSSLEILTSKEQLGTVKTRSASAKF